MRKIIAIIIIFSLFASTGYALGPVNKLGRGLANIITSPFELPQTMGEENEKDGIFAGLTVGLFKGVINVVKRLGVGAFETVTFPVPVPEGYEPILDDPIFIQG